MFFKEKFSAEEDLKHAKRFEAANESKQFEVVFFFWGGGGGHGMVRHHEINTFFLGRVLLRQAKYIRSIVMNFAAGNATAGKPSWPWLGFQYG